MIARKSALIVATEVVNGALAYVALFFITSYMSPEAYGILAFALSVTGIFTIVAKLGFDRAHVKRVSEGKDLGTCIGTFLATKFGLTGLMAAATVVGVLIWEVVMGRGFQTPEHELALYIILGHQAIRLITLTFVQTFKGKKEIAKARIPLFLEVVGRTGAIILVAVAGGDALDLALAYVTGSVVFFLSALVLFRGNPVKKPSREYIKDYAIFAYPMIIVVASFMVMTNIDKVLIQLFWSASDVGYYFAAFKISRFINMFALALGALLFPTFSALHAKRDIEGIRRLTYRSERYISMIVFPMVFGIVTLSGAATHVLLQGWKGATPILRVLPFFALLAALERPYQSQLTGMNRPHLARNRVLIMVCMNVVLNLVLIPQDIQSIGLKLAGWGAEGAAIATVASYGVGLLYSRYVALRLTETKGNPRILLHLLAAIVMALVLHWLNGMFFIARWYHLLGFALLGLGIYFGVLFLMREFTREDFDFFMDTLNIRKMGQYVRDEIRGK